MVNAVNKKELIIKRLQEKFSPVLLDVIDESDKHIGHAGHQGGGRHFAIIISSESFIGLNRVDVHRKIYALFNDLIPDEIHALRIVIKR
ncbi:MAG: BolA family transcriptional regulator [Gammaproteobacteria bacterium]|nr:BolA family transcriptional regulator [Gammaproteobacteria bacterium]